MRKADLVAHIAPRPVLFIYGQHDQPNVRGLTPSYYNAAGPPEIAVDSGSLDPDTADLLVLIYEQGLGEFAYQNRLDLRGRIRFPRESDSCGAATIHELPSPATAVEASAPALSLPRRTLVPIGGGKDSLVSVELLRRAEEPATCAWVGRSDLIAGCAAATGLPTLNIGRELSPLLFELNRRDRVVQLDSSDLRHGHHRHLRLRV